MIPAELSPPDACPRCDPGVPDAALPLGPVLDVDGGRVADYECGTCGTGWSAVFDRFGWVIERAMADVKDAATRRAA